MEGEHQGIVQVCGVDRRVNVQVHSTLHWRRKSSMQDCAQPPVRIWEIKDHPDLPLTALHYGVNIYIRAVQSHKVIFPKVGATSIICTQ